MKNPDPEEIFELIHLIESRQRRRVMATFIGMLLAAVIAGAIARVSYFEARKPLPAVGGPSEAHNDAREELERMQTTVIEMKAEKARLKEELERAREEARQAEAEATKVNRGGTQVPLQSPSDRKQLVQLQREITRLQNELATTREQLTVARQNAAGTERVELQKEITQLQQELDTTKQALTQEQHNVAVLSGEADRYRTDALALQRQMNEGAYHSRLNQALAYTYRNEPGDQKLAERAYREAIQIAEAKDVRDPMIYNAYATFLQNQKRFNEAEKFYKMALEVDPRYGKALNNLGTLYEARGDLKQALAKYKEADEVGEKLGKENYLRLQSRITR